MQESERPRARVTIQLPTGRTRQAVRHESGRSLLVRARGHGTASARHTQGVPTVGARRRTAPERPAPRVHRHTMSIPRSARAHKYTKRAALSATAVGAQPPPWADVQCWPRDSSPPSVLNPMRRSEAAGSRLDSAPHQRRHARAARATRREDPRDGCCRGGLTDGRTCGRSERWWGRGGREKRGSRRAAGSHRPRRYAVARRAQSAAPVPTAHAHASMRGTSSPKRVTPSLGCVVVMRAGCCLDHWP